MYIQEISYHLLGMSIIECLSKNIYTLGCEQLIKTITVYFHVPLAHAAHPIN